MYAVASLIAGGCGTRVYLSWEGAFSRQRVSMGVEIGVMTRTSDGDI
ncbi:MULTISPECIES: hypothetical protein [Bifidobacterium]|nr:MULTISPECIES: hypothetical protein [Bifidobacterium]